MAYTFAATKKRAATFGLHLTKYNPDNKNRFRLHIQIEDYFDGGIFTSLKLGEVEAFLDGWRERACTEKD